MFHQRLPRQQSPEPAISNLEGPFGPLTQGRPELSCAQALFFKLSKNLKKFNRSRTSFLPLNTWYCCLARSWETGDVEKEALEISPLNEKGSSSKIQALERNSGAWFYKLLLPSCLKRNHFSWVYIDYSLQLWLMPLPKHSGYIFLFHLTQSKEKLYYLLNRQP